MLYTSQNISTLDLSKYKRFVAIGCSFTQWRWPTWADIIANELDDNVDYINLGAQGAGNDYILTNFSQAKNYYNLGEEDLVGIMWTSFYRHSSYRGEHRDAYPWNCPGNIYTQDSIPLDVVNTHLDTPRGFAIKSLSYVHAVMEMLSNGKHDSFAMWGVHPNSQAAYTPKDVWSWYDVQTFYRGLDEYILPDLLGYGFNNCFPEGHVYYNNDGSRHHDYHPTTNHYCQYLKKINFPVNKSMESFASSVTNYIDQNFKTVEDFNDNDFGGRRYTFNIL